MEKIKDRIAKRVYVGECASSHSVGRPWKRWIDNVKKCLKKSGLDVWQAKRMVHDRSVWKGLRGGLQIVGWKSICGQAPNLRV